MWQLKIEHCNQDDAELISDFLEELGAVSVTMTDQFDDPILEPEPGSVPLWPHVVLHALYEPSCNMDLITHALSTQYPQLSYFLDTVVEQDWERTCLVDFKPQRFGKRLWICPSWLTPPVPDAINLILDPGLAFGTGSHPTTALCLNWLESIDLEQKTVIDYGCGSGILGIAALKLGAAHVHAVDIDEQALIATKNNAITNHLDLNTLTTSYPDILHTPVDVLIANILLLPLLKLKTRFRELLKDTGFLVVSGILANQMQELIDTYQPDFTLIASNREADWAVLTFEITKRTK
ncbi:MAG: 50S ribosomal protein L11 methyltransferase [Legionellaceae bacterium]|nr:50S ribosomal protein L11 methyltransferase [Legionellaceae bacterium]